LDDGDEDLKEAGLGLRLSELVFCVLPVDWIECLSEKVADELEMLLGWRCLCHLSEGTEVVVAMGGDVSDRG